MKKKLKYYLCVLDWIDKDPSTKTQDRKKRVAVDAWKQHTRQIMSDSKNAIEYSLALSLFNSISYRMADELTWPEFKKLIITIVKHWI